MSTVARSGQTACLQQLELCAPVGVVDRDVFDADQAVAAAVGAAAVFQRAGVALGDDGVLQADGASGVGLVEQAVVEHAEPDGDPGLPQQASSMHAFPPWAFTVAVMSSNTSLTRSATSLTRSAPGP